MGCDIHLMVEVRDKKLNQWKEYDIADELLKNIGRNYNLFSILANVRNGVGKKINIENGYFYFVSVFQRGIDRLVIFKCSH
ncbi:hypothetical protein QJB58_000919 [Listeria monocytogenes]|nr:hypothetical protein [Listeria monocytogenes]ELA3157315.1 hypothetical protein [Listeria monocytogenes]